MLLMRKTDPISETTRDRVHAAASRLLAARLLDPYDNRQWVTGAEIAAELDEPRVAVCGALMALGHEGLLEVRSTHVGLEMEVTGIPAAATGQQVPQTAPATAAPGR